MPSWANARGPLSSSGCNDRQRSWPAGTLFELLCFESYVALELAGEGLQWRTDQYTRPGAAAEVQAARVVSKTETIIC